jgi:acetylglutamate kinase
VSRVVLKVGGRVAAEAAARAPELVAEGAEVIVVHGAGPQISAEMERRGLVPGFVRGRRVTTPEVLAVVRESFKEVNAAVCATVGPRAIGLMGDEIGLVAEQVEELGLVGEPVPCAPSAVLEALASGRIPVVAPLAAGPLNVNADDAAAVIAVGVDADRLLFLTDVEGFMLDGEVVDTLDVPTAEALVAGGTLSPTILPKLGAAITAARHGVAAFIGRTEVEPLAEAAA